MRPTVLAVLALLALGAIAPVTAPAVATPLILQVLAGQKIQPAIDNAPVNSTIHVAAGTYLERLVVYKPLHLIGESRDNTIIDGGGRGTVIVVNRSNVEISGFGIRNAASYRQGIYLVGVSHVNVTNNSVNAAPNGDGVSLDGSSNNTITGNIFSGNSYAVNATNSNYNLIARNIALSNSVGVQVWSGQRNIVANNTLNSGQTGVYLYQAARNLLVRNQMVKNSEIGIFLGNSNNNTIIENSLVINKFGIDIQFSRNNTFYHNNIVSNTLYQVNFVSGPDKPYTKWDNGTAGCGSCVKAGNYWDDYTGTDPDRDGIGDTGLPADGVDMRPLMAPYIPLLLVVRVLSKALNGTSPFTATLAGRVVGGTAPYTFHWDFGDSGVAASLNTTHTYTSAGSYTAKLVVSDSAGASDQDTVSVSVGPTPVSNPPLLLWSAVGVSAAAVATLTVVWRRRMHRSVREEKSGRIVTIGPSRRKD